MAAAIYAVPPLLYPTCRVSKNCSKTKRISIIIIHKKMTHTPHPCRQNLHTKYQHCAESIFQTSFLLQSDFFFFAARNVLGWGVVRRICSSNAQNKKGCPTRKKLGKQLLNLARAALKQPKAAQQATFFLARARVWILPSHFWELLYLA